MSRILDLRGQKWKSSRPGELTLFLPHHRPGLLSYHLEQSFVPASVGKEDGSSDARMLQLDVSGEMPALGDWRELGGLVLESREEIRSLGEIVTPAIPPPEIEIWSHGESKGSIYTHEKGDEGWRRRMEFGEFFTDRDLLLPFSVEVFFPSKRAREAHHKAWSKCLLDPFTGEDHSEALEKAKQTTDGWTLRYQGEVSFTLFCYAPINTADPIGWAQSLARRELNLQQFGISHVNGGDWYGKGFKPEDGVSEQGRLVILDPAPPPPRPSHEGEPRD